MPRVRKLTSKEPIVVLGYLQGASIDLIASTHNVSAGTIRAVLKRNGVAIRKQGRIKRAQDV